MPTLNEIAPVFAAEVRAALESEGRMSLLESLDVAEVGKFSYDEPRDLGYIQFVWADPGYSGRLAGPVRETIPFAEPYWFNVDVDYDDRLFGIELDGRKDVIALLKEAL